MKTAIRAMPLNKGALSIILSANLNIACNHCSPRLALANCGQCTFLGQMGGLDRSGYNEQNAHPWKC